jgi:pyridoxal phosphate-dependent aminotransferase EpsN
MEKRIFLSPPHMSGKEQLYIHEAFETNWIAPLGPNVDAFEKDITAYTGTNGALALSSGTAAIHLALRLLGITKGDRVFCSSLTFIASANPALYEGAELVFIDLEPKTWNMSPVALEKALLEAKKVGQLPKAIIVVNLYGQSADMDPIMELCQKYDVPLIEDAAESLGAKYKGKSSGTFGKYGVFSFNGNKIITTSGGGMLVSDDLEGLGKARFLATQARDNALHYQHSQMGFNYRMSNILAGVGIAQLEALDERVKTRRGIFEYYKAELSRFEGIDFMEEPEGYYSTRWLSVLTIDPEFYNLTPHQIVEELNTKNIEVRPVWKPLHMQPLFEGVPFYKASDDFDFSKHVFERGLCLPSGSSLTKAEQDYVIEVLSDLLINHKK